MRCLFCGKELALLKRWTGGGEFCSEAHRQQYQEEYNQLALNRLLQAKPRENALEEDQPETDAKPPASKKPVETVASAPPAAPTHREPPPPRQAPKAAPPPRQAPVASPPPPRQAPVAAPPPVVREEPAYVAQVEVEPDPAELGGFLAEMPVPALAEVSAMVKPEIGLENHATPTLPLRTVAGPAAELLAGRTVGTISNPVIDYPTRRTDRGLEVREFVRTAPVLEVGSPTTGETGLETFSEPVALSADALTSVQPPQASPALWQEGEREFPTFGLELGSLARVVFRTTGLKDDEDGMPAMQAPTEPEPAPEIAAKPVVPPPVEEEVKQLPAPTPAKKSEPVPDLVTKPLPLTLHGLAAGKGKPVQIFTAAATGKVEVRIPRSTALPLRPVMALGPAPAEPAAKPNERKAPVAVKSEPKIEAKVEVKPEVKPELKTDPKKPQPQPPSRPDPRVVPTKVRKPEVRVLAPEKKEPVVAQPVTSPNKIRPEAPKPVDKRPVVQPAAALKPKEPLKPAPLPAASVSRTPEPTVDLGLPSLSLSSSSGNAFSRLPIGAKIGLALGLLAVIGGIFFTMRSSSGSAASSIASGPAEGRPLPISETSWITDWGNDTGASHPGQILMLRPSLGLTDYRLEFQAKIETKALGWVFRAKDPKNFYVTKLEVLKPGLNPTVSLVHFPVINGQELQRAETPLPMPVRQDTVYKIHFEAVGNHFTTWVLDHKVDDWTDDRIASGGVGLYNERGESAALKGGVSVIPLAKK